MTMAVDCAGTVIGVDGGNTKTLAIATDRAGRVIGVGQTGCSNWELLGAEAAAARIAEAIRAALTDKVRLLDVQRIHLGLAGLDWPDDEARLRQALAPHLGGVALSFENDAFLAVRACTAEGVGVTVSAGSGVGASFIDANGDRFFYGYAAEKGGGVDVDARALHALVRAVDGRGPETAITAAVLIATGHDTVDRLLYAMTRESYTLPHSVTRRALFGAAREGDAVAAAIVSDFARELALLATNIIRARKLGGRPVSVVASGSLFTRTGPLMYGVFEETVRAQAPLARVDLCRLPPAAGAVRVALEGCGVDSRRLWEVLTPQLAHLSAALE